LSKQRLIQWLRFLSPAVVRTEEDLVDSVDKVIEDVPEDSLVVVKPTSDSVATYSAHWFSFK
jgi:hypothetical protein